MNNCFPLHSLNGENGLTLIEMMVAMLLLVIFLAPALSGFILAQTESQRNKDTMQATSIATRILEDIKDKASIDFFGAWLGGQISDPDPKLINDADTLNKLESLKDMDPRFEVQMTVKVWAVDPVQNIEMMNIKEVTVKVYRVGQTAGEPLSTVSQWITQGGP